MEAVKRVKPWRGVKVKKMERRTAIEEYVFAGSARTFLWREDLK